MIESKKKTKCDMNIFKYISEINFPETKEEKVYTEEEKIDSEIFYRNNLRKYIYLCEITQKFSKKYRWNYIANINFLLKKLNFELYFEDKETLESLKQRINNKYVPRIIKNKEFHVKLVEYPENLSVNKKTPVLTKKKKKETETIKKKNFLLPKNILVEPKEDENKCKEITPSDEESDSEDECNDMFDIDNYYSEEDYEEFDSGEFSD